MSLLEDVFLQDEANEAEELERVIEGDEFEERRRSDSDENSEKEDEAEEDKRRVDPTKTKTTKVVRNPRFLLNPARLTGPRGIQVIPDHFKDFKFKGKGYEKEDLDVVLKRLEHWAYRLYPKFQFEDCLKKIETLGKKRPVAVHLHKIRSDQFQSEDTVVQKDSSDEDTPMPVQEEDEFDKLLQQQIELARSTPAPNSAKKPAYNGSISPKLNRTTSLMMPKATSSPSINDEQRERMLRSRKLAEERRLARLKNTANTNTTVSKESTNLDTEDNIKNSQLNIEQTKDIVKDTEETIINRRQNRLNVIDSSDDETAEDTCITIEVDVHTASKVKENGVKENEKCTNNIIDDNDLMHEAEVKDIDDKSDEKEDATNNGPLSQINDKNQEKSNKNCDEAENDNMSKEHRKYDVNLNIADIGNKHSANEELRYDSDMNLDLNDHNKSETNNDSVIDKGKNLEVKEVKNVSNDKENSTKELGTEALSCTEETTNENNEISVTVQNIDVIDEASSQNKNVPEEDIEDVMDVDFNEDF